MVSLTPGIRNNSAMRVDQIAQAIDTIVPATVRYDHRLLVNDPDVSHRVAARGAVEASWPACRQCAERRSLDQGAISRRDAVHLLEKSRRIGRLFEHGLQLLHGGDDVAVSVQAGHALLP
jgi:hypothetical protein